MYKLLYALQCDIRDASRQLLELSHTNCNPDMFNSLFDYIQETKRKADLLELYLERHSA